MVGLLNKKTVLSNEDTILFNQVRFKAFELCTDKRKLSVQLARLKEWGFETVKFSLKNHINEKMLEKLQMETAKNLNFAIDGIVVRSNYDHQPYPRKANNPKYAIAFKATPACDIQRTIVTSVQWEASVNGKLKPRIEVEPVDLSGSTISFVSGHNAKFILTHGIAPGAEVEVILVGKAIPQLGKVLLSQPVKSRVLVMALQKQTNASWDATRSELVTTTGITDKSNTDILAKIIALEAKKLGVTNIGLGKCRLLVRAGYTHYEDILAAKAEDLSAINGFSLKGAGLLIEAFRESFKSKSFDDAFMAMGLPAGISSKKMRPFLERGVRSLDMETIKSTSQWTEKSGILLLHAVRNFVTRYKALRKLVD